MDTIVVEARFRGPPDSVNGGYMCGRVAAFVDGTAEVTLRAPPPLDTPMRVERDDGTVTVHDGDTLIAEGRPARLDLAVPDPVDFDDAVVTSKRYAGHVVHPFPTCFVCGPERDEGSGLRIFPGPLEGGEVFAAPWVPDPGLCGEDGVVPAEVVWAALDCPSAWTYHGKGRLIVLGRLVADARAPIRCGERLVSLSWPLEEDGRKFFAGSALLDDEGVVRARSHATWIELRT